MPLGNDYGEQNCSIARTLEVVGERWTLLILRDAFHGLTRFEEFQRSLGVASNILTARLDKLLAMGILEPEQHDAVGRRRGYRLTEKGAALSPVLATMMAWGDRYGEPGIAASVELMHEDCGQMSQPELRCDHCRKLVTAENTRLLPGPGASEEARRLGLTPPQLAAWGESRGR